MIFRRFPFKLSILAVSLVGLSVLVARANSDSIEKKLKELSGPSFIERENSMRDLLELGDELLPWVDKLSAKEDPELKWRLYFIKNRILTGVNDNTGEEIRELVDEFPEAKLHRKQDIVGKLMESGEWRIVFGLYLLSSEQPQLAPVFEPQALRAIQELARAEIRTGDMNQAEKVLSRGALFPDAQKAYASFLVAAGKTLPEDPALMLELHFLILSGQFDKAKSHAGKFGLRSDVEAIQLAVGDFQSMLDTAIESQQLSASVVQLAEWLKAENEGEEENFEEFRLQSLTQARALRAAGKAKNPAAAQKLLFKLAAIGEIAEARRLYREVLYNGSLKRDRSVLPSPQAFFADFGLNDLTDNGIRQWFEEAKLFDDRTGALDRKTCYAFYYLLNEGKQPLLENLLREKIDALPKNKRQQARMRFLSEFGIVGMRVSRRLPELHKILYAIACDVLDADEDKSVSELAKILIRPNSTAVRAMPFIHEVGREMHPDFGRAAQLKFDLAILRYGLQAEAAREQQVAELLDHLRRHEKPTLNVLIDAFLAVDDADSAWKAYQINNKEIKAESAPLLARYLLISERWEELADSNFQAQFLGVDPQQALRIEAKVLAAKKDVESKKRADQLKKISRLSVLADKDVLESLLADLYNHDESERFLDEMQKLIASGGKDILKQEIIDLGRNTEIEFWQAYYELLIKMGDYDRAITLCQDRLLQVYRGDFVSGRKLGMYRLILIEDARYRLDLARGLYFLELGKRDKALSFLKAAVVAAGQEAPSADVFFPALIQYDEIRSEVDQWFQKLDQSYIDYLRVFPRSPSALNARSWSASRAARNLEQAEKDIEIALDIDPTSGPLMDTLAEIKFAQGKRKEAIEISKRACRLEPYDRALKRQLKHFEKDPLPRAQK